MWRKWSDNIFVILSEAKNLYEDDVFLERFFASLRMTWIGTPFLVWTWYYPIDYSMFIRPVSAPVEILEWEKSIAKTSSGM